MGVHSTFTAGFTTRSWLGHYTSRLEIGVAVFFVISGFLLYRPFVLAHFEARPASSARAFWARRLRRIIPAYWLAFIVITYVLGADHVLHNWWSPFVYLGFAQIYSPHYAVTGITQAWTLCTEMMFYLLVPLWAALVARAARSHGPKARAAWRQRRLVRGGSGGHDARRVLRAELVAGASLVVVGEVFRAACLASGTRWPSLMLDWLPANLDLFGVGMLMAVASAWWATGGSAPTAFDRAAAPWASWALAAATFVVVGSIGLSVLPLPHQTLGSGMAREVLYLVFALLLVAPAVFGPQDRGSIRALLRWRPVAALGVVSYGIYLWHQAWITLWLRWTHDQLFTFSLWRFVPFVVAMAVVSATASWWGVERWVIRRRAPRIKRPDAEPTPSPALVRS